MKTKSENMRKNTIKKKHEKIKKMKQNEKK
jgi:hypothetical protein